MITTTVFFATRREAEKWRDRYLERFPPAGYGSTATVYFRVGLRDPLCRWAVCAERMKSCD